MESFNFDSESDRAVENEAIPDKETTELEEIETVLETDNETDSETDFIADSVFIMPFLAQLISQLFIFLFGDSEKGRLNDKEMDGFNGLFDRGSNVFGFRKVISGFFGFVIELILRVFGAFMPRYSQKELRDHFNNLFKNSYGEEDQNSKKTVLEGEKENVPARAGNRTVIYPSE